MNVVDSSGWLEFFADGPNAAHFAVPLARLDRVVVPTISIYEVFKKLMHEVGEDGALQGVAQMCQAKVVDLNVESAMTAARISSKHKIPMADSIIMATAQIHGAILWTQDDDFKHMPGVKYIPKKQD